LKLSSLADLRAAISYLPQGDAEAAAAAAARQGRLTKPPGSLGQFEDLAIWLARWQGRSIPRLECVEIIVFAGNHGVTARGVSPYPAAVTAQMVGNFAAGGAAINQLAKLAEATLKVMPLDLDRPTGDIASAPAMDETAFLAAATTGFDAVSEGTDLLCLGEMGIGNTTVAAALCAGLFGGNGADWVGRGTGIDDAGLQRKAETVDAAIARHASADPLALAMRLGGRELAAILGAIVAARHRAVPVLLDGFVCTAAAAPLAKMQSGVLDHCRAAHVSAEAAHRRLLDRLKLSPLLDLGMRLGEASGAAVAMLLARAAVACHAGMATFADAGVSER
jgi:nicotinate-nucleotide--dimethylbenzimidazole phosphoribosyltransferase